MKYLYFILLFVLLNTACNNSSTNSSSSSTATATFEGNGYTLVDLGNGASLASRADASGNLLEQGVVRNGVKDGTWVTLNPKGVIKTVTSYVNGQLSGYYLQYDDRGQLEAKTAYLNNEFNGPSGKYKFGRPTELSNYKNGQLDGKYIKYFSNTDKVQMEATYKDGLQDGTYKFYNEEGQVIMDYVYKNGKKISGGVVE